MTDLRSDLDARRGEPAERQSGTLSYALHVDGERRQVEDAWLAESLLFVLRERIGMRRTKAGCARGECGACTVLVDGRLSLACMVLAASATGSTILTSEGLGTDADPIRRALVEYGGVQCGVCTPGVVVAIHDLLARHTYLEEQDISAALAGTACPCGASRRVVEAVRALVSER